MTPIILTIPDEATKIRVEDKAYAEGFSWVVGGEHRDFDGNYPQNIKIYVVPGVVGEKIMKKVDRRREPANMDVNVYLGQLPDEDPVELMYEIFY